MAFPLMPACRLSLFKTRAFLLPLLLPLLMLGANVPLENQSAFFTLLHCHKMQPDKTKSIPERLMLR